MAAKQKAAADFRVEIGLKDGTEWSAEKIAQIKAMAKELHANRSAEQILKNEVLSIRYQMEAYADADEKQISRPVSLVTFLQAYLSVMGLSFRKFATAIEMNDANLKKYISGERKFNADLAKKFGRFFHTSPLTWMKVYQLNDLIQLRSERVEKRYDKYDFMKVAHLGGTQRFSASAVKRAGTAVKEIGQWVGKASGRNQHVNIDMGRGKVVQSKEVKVGRK
jgi:antitoxin HigA-1